jgi:hypothetical protein
MGVIRIDSTISGHEHGVDPREDVGEAGTRIVADQEGATHTNRFRVIPRQDMRREGGMMEATANTANHSQ